VGGVTNCCEVLVWHAQLTAVHQLQWQSSIRPDNKVVLGYTCTGSTCNVIPALP
jgi:hypothetical protein